MKALFALKTSLQNGLPKSLQNLITRSLALLLLFTANAYAETSVWKVSKGDDYLFLGGTIHVLSMTDYPLPEEFEEAYQQSQHIVFEVDAAELQSIEAQQKLVGQMVLTNGETLQTLLSPETYQRLEEYVAGVGLPMQNLNMLNPSMLASMLEVLELQRLGMAVQGVDAYYGTKSMGDGKTTGFLETIDQQIAFLLAMGEGREDELIAYTLDEIGELGESITDLKRIWRIGDADSLDEEIIVPMRSEFPDIYQGLLVDRNNAWLPQIEAMMSTAEIEFVLAGAAHMVGADGLVEQLQAMGYTVEQL